MRFGDLRLSPQHVHRAHEDRRLVDRQTRDARVDALRLRVRNSRRVDVDRDERRRGDAREVERGPGLSPDPDVDDDAVGAREERCLSLDEPAIEEPESPRRRPSPQSSVP